MFLYEHFKNIQAHARGFWNPASPVCRGQTVFSQEHARPLLAYGEGNTELLLLSFNSVFLWEGFKPLVCAQGFLTCLTLPFVRHIGNGIVEDNGLW